MRGEPFAFVPLVYDIEAVAHWNIRRIVSAFIVFVLLLLLLSLLFLLLYFICLLLLAILFCILLVF